MSQNKIDREDIQKAIYLKFNTQKECADALGISEMNLANRLQKPSKRLLAQLEAIGVVIQSCELTTQELKELVDKTNKEIERLKAKILDIQDEIGELKQRG